MLPYKSLRIQMVLVFVFTLFYQGAVAQQISDTEIKKSITSIDNALTRLLKLEPKSFTYDHTKHSYLALGKGRKFGFVAEDIGQTFPELVHEKSIQYMFGKNVYRTAKLKTVDEAGLIPVLVASIKEQQAQIERLQREIEALKTGKAVAVN